MKQSLPAGWKVESVELTPGYWTYRVVDESGIPRPFGRCPMWTSVREDAIKAAIDDLDAPHSNIGIDLALSVGQLFRQLQGRPPNQGDKFLWEGTVVAEYGRGYWYVYGILETD